MAQWVNAPKCADSTIRESWVRFPVAAPLKRPWQAETGKVLTFEARRQGDKVAQSQRGKVIEDCEVILTS